LINDPYCSQEKEKEEEVIDSSDQQVPIFSFTAPQIINRFIEIYSDTRISAENRLNSLMDLFHIDIFIASLKSEKQLLVGSEAVRQSFAHTQACFAETARRIYIPCPVPVDTASDKNYSYVLDLHAPGATPGLGDRSKDTVLLYECVESDVKINHVWGAVDIDKLASKETLSKLEVCQSQAWKWALTIILKQYPSFDHTSELHYHDYTNIETI